MTGLQAGRFWRLESAPSKFYLPVQNSYFICCFCFRLWLTLLTDAIPLLEHEEVGDFGCVCFFFLSFSFQIFINNELLAVMNNKIYPGYWFARDVTAAMLVVRDNSISLLYFRGNSSKTIFSIYHQHCRLVTWLQTKNRAYSLVGSLPRP